MQGVHNKCIETAKGVNNNIVHMMPPQDEGSESPPPRRRGRPKAVERMVRVSYTLPSALAAQIEAYWHARHLPSRSEAIRKLLQHGLGGV